MDTESLSGVGNRAKCAVIQAQRLTRLEWHLHIPDIVSCGTVQPSLNMSPLLV